MVIVAQPITNSRVWWVGTITVRAFHWGWLDCDWAGMQLRLWVGKTPFQECFAANNFHSIDLYNIRYLKNAFTKNCNLTLFTAVIEENTELQFPTRNNGDMQWQCWLRERNQSKYVSNAAVIQTNDSFILLIQQLSVIELVTLNINDLSG